MKSLRTQFAVRRLLVIMGVYSLLFAMVSGLPAAQIVAAVFVTTVFVIIDLACGGATQQSPRWSRAALVVSHYATAFAFSAVACCAVYLYSVVHAPPPPPPKPRPIWELPDVLAEGIGGIGVALWPLFYLLFGTAFGIVGWVAALISVRHYRGSVVLLIANTPWLLLAAYVLIGAFLEWD